MLSQKNRLAALVALMLLYSSTASGQPGGNAVFPYQPARDPAAAQRLLDGINPVSGALRLDAGTVVRIEALGLESTPATVRKVHRLLDATADHEAKVFLLRLLGSLYGPHGRDAGNEEIAQTLRAYVSGHDRRLATEALLTYSRTGHHPDRIGLLDYGRKRGLIDANSYAQELAIGFLYSPPAAQRAAALRLADQNNAFGADVLASCLHRDAVATLPADVRAVLQTFLGKNEPAMPQAIGELGLTDAIRYADWLEAVALLSEAAGQARHAQFVFGKLNRPDTDPRKVLAYLSSPHGIRFMQAIGSRATLAPVTERALLPSRQFPGHPVFPDLSDPISRTLAKLKD